MALSVGLMLSCYEMRLSNYRSSGSSSRQHPEPATCSTSGQSPSKERASLSNNSLVAENPCDVAPGFEARERCECDASASADATSERQRSCFGRRESPQAKQDPATHAGGFQTQSSMSSGFLEYQESPKKRQSLSQTDPSQRALLRLLAPGDAEQLLPPPELRRQVGLRWPQHECHVIIRGQ